MRHAKRAESIIETLIAITVIVLATTAALSVLRTAQQGNSVIGNKVIAINLAMEAFEAIRNVRDTNYLILSSDPDGCWNVLGVTDVADCSTAAQISDGVEYYLTRDYSGEPMFKWTLSRLTNVNTQGFINLYDIDANLDGTAETQLYAQNGISTVSEMDDQAENRRLFQRTILIEYPDPDYFTATVTVTWTENGVEEELILTRTIAHVY